MRDMAAGPQSRLPHQKKNDAEDKLGPRKVGKYLISPMTRRLANGWIACSVSIRSGSGQATTDRVLRLTRLFRDQVQAAEYALAEGMQWIGVPRATPRLA